MTESPENVEADVTEIKGLVMSEDNIASVQGVEIPQLNDQVSALNTSVNLLRSYTPELGPAPPSAGDQGAEAGTTSESRAALDADLTMVLNEINSARPDRSSNEANPANWTAELPAQNLNSAGTDTLSQDADDLQEVNTQLTTEVQTETAQASQTTQMSNTMSQATSSVLANLLEEKEAASKE
jgi:hypothetical protein